MKCELARNLALSDAPGNSAFDGLKEDMTDVSADVEYPFGLRERDLTNIPLNSSHRLVSRMDFTGIIDEDQLVPSCDIIHSKFPPKLLIWKPCCQYWGNSKKFIEIMVNRKGYNGSVSFQSFLCPSNNWQSMPFSVALHENHLNIMGLHKKINCYHVNFDALNAKRYC
jgi:hypothetical protein